MVIDRAPSDVFRAVLRMGEHSRMADSQIRAPSRRATPFRHVGYWRTAPSAQVNVGATWTVTRQGPEGPEWTRCILTDLQPDRRLEWTAAPQEWKRPTERYWVELDPRYGATEVTFSLRRIHPLFRVGGWAFVLAWPFERRAFHKTLDGLKGVAEERW